MLWHIFFGLVLWIVSFTEGAKQEDELKSLPRGVERWTRRSDAVYKTALEIFENVVKIIENRGQEGSKI